MCKSQKMEDLLETTISEYNELRSPYAKAKLLEVKGSIIKVQFEGHFCESCCMDEYFLDLVYELEPKGIEIEFLGFHFVESETFIAKYRIINRND